MAAAPTSDVSEIIYVMDEGILAGDQHFNRPSNAETVEEDEEELLWAAVERVPSLNRNNFALLRRSASTSASRSHEVVDVRKLDQQKRSLILQEALATSEQDNFNLLSKLKTRFDAYAINFYLNARIYLFIYFYFLQGQWPTRFSDILSTNFRRGEMICSLMQ
jgi:hypothetical protein